MQDGSFRNTVSQNCPAAPSLGSTSSPRSRGAENRGLSFHMAEAVGDNGNIKYSALDRICINKSNEEY